MRCAVNATTEKGPRVAVRSLLSAGRCAASCGVPLQIARRRRRRRKEIGLLPSFLPCPACFFDGAAVDGSFVIVAGSVQFRNGNGMGAWQKGEHRNERRNELLNAVRHFRTSLDLKTVSRSRAHTNPPRKHAHDRGAEGFSYTHSA